jgi:hypothetical protein
MLLSGATGLPLVDCSSVLVRRRLLRMSILDGTPRLTLDDARRLARERFGLDGTASPLPLPVDPAGPIEVLKLIEKARELATATA